MTQHEKKKTTPLKSERVDELVAELVAGADLAWIAKQEDLTPAQAMYLKRKASLTQKKARWTEAERERAAALYERGEELDAIARTLDRALVSVKRELVRQGKLVVVPRVQFPKSPRWWRQSSR